MSHRLLTASLLTLALTSAPVLAQRQWIRQNSGTSSDLNAVFFTDANNGTAVGLGGTILRTTDGGQTWTRQVSGTLVTLNGVHFTDVNTGTAVGLDGDIYRTTNGGQTWTFQDGGTSSHLNDVFFTDASNGTAVGLGGTILRTTNAGQTWTRQVSGTLVTLNGVHFTDANTGTAVGLDGDIFRTTNGGQTWVFQDGGTSSHLNDVFFTNANVGTTVGLGGTILRTLNGGQTWTRQTSNTPVALNGVHFTDDDRGTIVGLDGDIFSTNDGGQTWVFEDGGTSSHLNDVFFTDANTGTAVGIGGLILRTAPCTFGISPAGVSVALGGGKGTIAVTANTGCHWDAVSGSNWITIDAGVRGTGNGVVAYTVAANDGGQRTGTIVVGGHTFTITQTACTYDISPNTASFPTAGGAGTVTVTTGPSCAWTAQSGVSWITITGGSNGTGNGVVNYSVAANSGDPRNGTLTIAGLTFTATQGTTANRSPIVANTIADRLMTVRGPVLSIDLSAPPAVFEDPDGDPLDYSVFSSNTAVAAVTINGSIVIVTPGVEGTAIITIEAWDPFEAMAETSFVVTVTVDCWVVDTFDNVPLGSLNGANGWFTGDARSDASVVANPSGLGQVLLMDAGPGQTVNMGKDVDDRSNGTHSIKVDVLVEGPLDATEPTLAKIEIRTTGNPTWDKKFQLYFGAHMRLNFGPREDSALIFLPEQELTTNRWYQVEAIIDLTTNLVDVYVDGVLRLTNVAVGSGPITDISISAWDRPGRVFYDNLRFCRTNDAPPTNACVAASTFDYSTEGWTVIGDAQSSSVVPNYHATGGNPDGYVSARDNVTGQRWYWQAPRTFVGDALCVYGQTLEFDLQQSNTTSQFDAEDIVLEGNGLTLVFDTPCNPGLCGQNSEWTHYSVPLLETAGWIKDELGGAISGDPPTRAEMEGVLGSLTRLLIRGEYRRGSDIGGLDNVMFRVPARDMAMTVWPNSQTVTAGSSADYSISISPVGGVLDGDVVFSCSGLPEHATCTFAPDIVKPGRRIGSSTLTITTTAPTASGVQPHTSPVIPRRPLALAHLLGALVLLFVVVSTSHGRRFRRFAWALPVVLMTLVQLGCKFEDGITDPQSEATGTPTGTFNVAIVATAAGLERATNVTLIVQ